MDEPGRFWDHREARWADSARAPGDGEWLPAPREPVEAEDRARPGEPAEEDAPRKTPARARAPEGASRA